MRNPLKNPGLQNILTKINHRNELFKMKKNNPENRHFKQVYNKFRNSVNRDIKKSKEIYYSKYFENCKNSMKKHGKASTILFDQIPIHHHLRTFTTITL